MMKKIFNLVVLVGAFALMSFNTVRTKEESNEIATFSTIHSTNHVKNAALLNMKSTNFSQKE